MVPQQYWRSLLKVPLRLPTRGHLGRDKVETWIRGRFCCPGVLDEVQEYCEFCPLCQNTAPNWPSQTLLTLLPLTEALFERGILNIVGPLPERCRVPVYTSNYGLYVTQYHKVVLLRMVTAVKVAGGWLKFFSQVGLP